MSLSQEGEGTMTTPNPAIRVEGLIKRYGKTIALRGLELTVDEGTVLGVLGPNGAGKTTTVRILSTLLRPDGGHAEVAGFDVVAQPDRVRARIGLTGQYAAVDELLTGRENLELVARLAHLGRAQARRRAAELLLRFDLTHAAARTVRTYSGGMRRRLDLAASLVAAPAVLFLDEPTTGLDPRSRLAMWQVIGELVSKGTTVLLTTQYLEEADRLADRVAVIAGGRLIASGTADQLKAQVGGQGLELTVARGADLAAAADAVQPFGQGPVRSDPDLGRLTLPVAGGAALLPAIVRRLDEAGAQLADLALRRPTLDEVFLALTGAATTRDADTQNDQEVA
jgi:ABC-2 type transport system ATP-binding protein